MDDKNQIEEFVKKNGVQKLPARYASGHQLSIKKLKHKRMRKALSRLTPAERQQRKIDEAKDKFKSLMNAKNVNLKMRF